MEYTKLGNTGMDVSRFCLGTMGFGDPNRWIHSWVLEQEQSRPVIQHAIDVGINFFDTANVYSLGRSEEILGKALRDTANRDEIVVATKIHGRMHEDRTAAGSRARPSSARSTRVWAGSAWTMSTSTSSIAGITTRPSRRRWRR